MVSDWALAIAISHARLNSSDLQRNITMRNRSEDGASSQVCICQKKSRARTTSFAIARLHRLLQVLGALLPSAERLALARAGA
jgi:hypothetical protein